ncbi:hypothetical protein DID78_00470 [Candidatus Marinamargulisbacteria bacterium SCGC AG-343-D04]|nr:hypothetical protein DID78_00470 [Candidatus Marinamargulisbacteria bacterium SCGC AG-343-D04]
MNVFAWGFDNKCNPNILRELEKKGDLNIKVWVKQTRHKIPWSKALIYYYDDLFIFQKIEKTPLAPEDIIIKAQKFLEEFLLMQVRHQINFCANEKVISRSVDDDIYLFYRLVHFFYEKLTRENINLVIHANIFHEGADFVLYKMAKILNIKTRLCMQTIFPGKFIIINSIEEFGNITQTRPKLYKKSNYKYEFSGKPAKLFYMTNIEDAVFSLKELKKNFSLESLLKENKIKLIISFLIGNFSHIAHFLDANGRRFRIPILKTYIQNMKTYSKNKVDLSVPYVYIPLPYQPELSSATLGGNYTEQVKIIETVSRWIPKNVKIYIKENPKQMESMRSTGFFERLNNIRNTTLISGKFSSFELIKNCQCVALSSGNTGWEAIQMKKPLITFGYAWYNNLPGVFWYKNKVTYEEVVSWKNNDIDIQKEVRSLTEHFGDGLVDRDYKSLLTCFDESYNTKLVVNSILASI